MIVLSRTITWLLLALVLLLGSCRSERMVFAFQPAVDEAASAESIPPPSRMDTSVATRPASPATGTLPALPRHLGQAHPLPARRDSEQRLSAVSLRVASARPCPLKPQASRRSWTRRSPHRVVDRYNQELWFDAGLIGVGIGSLCLIAALIFWSVLLALGSLGMLLLGIFLIGCGYAWDGRPK